MERWISGIVMPKVVKRHVIENGATRTRTADDDTAGFLTSTQALGDLLFVLPPNAHALSETPAAKKASSSTHAAAAHAMPRALTKNPPHSLTPHQGDRL
jgi:hypothetical protein